MSARVALLEIGLWMLGASLLAAFGAARVHADVQRERASATFDEARSAASAAHGGAQGASVPDQSDWSAGRVRAYARDTVLPAQALPAAVLRIPMVGLAVPVYSDTSERNLNRGAGLIAGTAQVGGPGNVAIAGHRDGFFRALKDIAVGDRLELETLSGTRVYRVTELSVVMPEDTSPLRPTQQAAVTLVTCYPFYFVGNAPQRFIVRALAADRGE